MVELILVAMAALAPIGAVFVFQARRRLAQFSRELERTWAEVERGLRARRAALEELASALRQAGYASEGERRLREALSTLERSAADPRALAETDDQVEAVLRGIYRALPRERDERVRRAQNRLAEADEEFDLHKNRYNELVFAWYNMARRFPYRFLLRGRKRPEPLALPGEEEELFRRYLLT